MIVHFTIQSKSNKKLIYNRKQYRKDTPVYYRNSTVITEEEYSTALAYHAKQWASRKK